VSLPNIFNSTFFKKKYCSLTTNSRRVRNAHIPNSRRVRNAHIPNSRRVRNAHIPNSRNEPVRIAHPTNSIGAQCAPYKLVRIAHPTNSRKKLIRRFF